MTEPALSVPAAFTAPRPLTDEEIKTLRAIADLLVPPSGSDPAATDDPGFDGCLRIAADARADAFDTITDELAVLRGADPDTIDKHLRELHGKRPHVFQPLSAVVAGAWLLLPTVRERIGYPGQRRDPAPFDQSANELSTDILDPVLARGTVYTPAPKD
ncbi:hypothetical protein ACFU7X_00695 [Streptomyces chartreusis]|uniref:hypothetical protein n=1 Tax=Streptomyces chartreusis TaxID=1969 RepID=UPI003699FC9A